MVNKRAKIVATIGPASSDLETLRAMMRAGMNVCRLNFSHGSHEQKQEIYQLIREAEEAEGLHMGILADLQGPKIRLGTFAEGKAVWENGAHVVITTDEVEGTAERVSTTYKALADDVVVGNKILVDDGNLALTVDGVDGNDVHCTVVEGGPVSNNKGLNLVGVNVSAPALSEKDEEDLRFALTLPVDWVALSFVRSPDDVDRVRQIMDEERVNRPVLAKLEKPEAVDALPEIVERFDGLMVARGDLGVEMPLEEVPLVQKQAIHLCRQNAKPVIVATQMLESMITHSRPTRAEASDVANAVLDGADAVMLSGETGVGAHPVGVVATMASIISATEAGGVPVRPLDLRPEDLDEIPEVVTMAAANISRNLGAAAIVVATETGSSAELVARHRTEVPIIAITPHRDVRNALMLVWGVTAARISAVTSTDQLIERVNGALLRRKLVHAGDKLVVIIGSPPGKAGSANTVRVHTVSESDLD